MPDSADLQRAQSPAAAGFPEGSPRPRWLRPRWLGVALALVVVAIFCALFDWNWFRPALERYVSRTTHREFRLSDLQVRLGWTPVITMRDVYMANAPWSDQPTMADIKLLKFSLSLRDLFAGRQLVPELDVRDGSALLEHTADGRKNWILSDPNDTRPSTLRISTLHAEHFTLRYRDASAQLDVTATANDLATAGILKSNDARFSTRIDFHGSYKSAPFDGEALTANLITFEQSDLPFPLLAHVNGGKTSVDIDGTISDIAQLKAIDAKVRIKGETLANIYPYVLLPLPASPPYQIDGVLDFRGGQYRYGQFHGRIGETDLTGDASYTARQPRPLLQIRLHSSLLNLADLGPLIGVQTKSGTGTPPPATALADRNSARVAVQASNGAKQLSVNNDRILPSGSFDPRKMRAIDAKVTLVADRLKTNPAWPVDSLSFNLDLNDGILKLEPVDFGFAGGHLLGQIELNGQQQPIIARADIEARGIDLERLLPHSPRISPSEGRLAASLKLSGQGDSIATLLAQSNGDIRGVVSGGEVSNLADAAIGLNGGKVLRLLATGDQVIPIRCAAIDLAVTNGIGQSRTFLIDTEQTEVQGQASVNFADEYLDITLNPQPKHPDILSLRSPLHVFGPFAHPDFGVDKTALVERAGATLVLGLLNPLAALIPLLETGPGHDADCTALLSANALAKTTGPTTGKSIATTPAPTPAAPVKPPPKRE